MRWTRIFASIPVAVAAMSLLSLTGCEWNSFINPGEPHIVLNKNDNPLVVPVVDTLDRGIEEPDTAYQDAIDVRPEDLIPDTSDYRIGNNDLISVSIFDLMGEGTGETVKQARVSESGFITLPFIAPVKATGLTEQELENAVVKAYQDAQLIRNARVSATVVEARNNTFSIMGNAANPGEFQIDKSNFRMLDALVTGRAPAQSIGVKYAYIIRKVKKAAASTPAAAPTNVTPTPAPSPAPTSQPSDLLEPHTQANGKGVVLADILQDEPATTAPFQFNDLQSPSSTIVIRVPIDALRQGGELKYNIVIRPGDLIVVPDPTTGEFYIGGHVLRVGVYSLTARQITLKQAYAMAGGPDQFAIPGRTEIIRRVGMKKEVFARVDLDKVLAGMQPDMYLKPYDVIQVGTNFFAPFLSAARNSFTITYGFGFLYDRNFYTGTGS